MEQVISPVLGPGGSVSRRMCVSDEGSGVYS